MVVLTKITDEVWFTEPLAGIYKTFNIFFLFLTEPLLLQDLVFLVHHNVLPTFQPFFCLLLDKFSNNSLLNRCSGLLAVKQNFTLMSLLER